MHDTHWQIPEKVFLIMQRYWLLSENGIDNKLFFSPTANKQNYLLYYDLKEKKSGNIRLPYPEHSFAIPKNTHSYLNPCMMTENIWSRMKYKKMMRIQWSYWPKNKKIGIYSIKIISRSLSFQHIFVLKPIEWMSSFLSFE